MNDTIYHGNITYLTPHAFARRAERPVGSIYKMIQRGQVETVPNPVHAQGKLIPDTELRKVRELRHQGYKKRRVELTYTDGTVLVITIEDASARPRNRSAQGAPVETLSTQQSQGPLSVR